ncbi:MAG: hypothetical protein AMXMBFR20_11610 [Planctomycetia bacterium]
MMTVAMESDMGSLLHAVLYEKPATTGIGNIMPPAAGCDYEGRSDAPAGDSTI